MVYRGIPSKACEYCSAKCDEKRPQCSRCLGLGKICSGYRDRSTLLFRDETSKTKEKIRQRRTSQHGREIQLLKNADSLVMETSFVKYSTLHPPLLPSKEDIAICHFYHSTVENLSIHDPTLSLQEQLPRLHATCRPDSALRLALEAVSLAASAKIIPQAVQLGLKRYLKAVRALREAMQSEKRGIDYQALYSVLLLCGYETITGHLCMPLAWGSHVDGALALLKLQTSHVDSSLFCSMYFFVQKNVVMSQMQICQPVDEIFTQGLISSCHDPEIRLLAIAAGIPRLQHQSIDLTQLRANDIERIVFDANELDFLLATWAKGLPTAWFYATALNINDDACSEYSPQSIHRYAHFYTARVWNFYRVSQLVLLSIQLRASSTLPASLDTSQIRKRMATLVDDICATVPYLLGKNLCKMNYQFVTSRGTPDVSLLTSDSTVEKVGNVQNGKFSLVWPLYVACSASEVTQGQRNWIRKQLQHLAQGGIPIAQTVFLLPRRSATRRARYSLADLRCFVLTAYKAMDYILRNG
ncbi:c6 zinc finger [Fusarium pseudocircinatum]|uniref:C6 zinc finger n=1 Tax=Fusarium pseudocircinatum TaxID=56676 RepID=A0A8H5UMA4_9HYPO|nr:c6 zinc finger [Fusarium pseudocircinatum]